MEINLKNIKLEADLNHAAENILHENIENSTIERP
jgi:hypothetical protein